MPCSNGAWRFLPLPDRAKHKQKKARNYAGLAAFHAIRCLAVPDAESFPLDYYNELVSLAITGFHQIYPSQYRHQYRLQKNA